MQNLIIPILAAIFLGTTTAQADVGDQLHKLLANDGAAEDSFGISVAISGVIAVIGAHFDDDNGSSSGSAYLFDIASGKQIAKLLPDDGEPNNYFGSSVAISETTAIIGAWGDNDNGSASGSAYLFDITTGQQIVKILPKDGAEHDNFGISVAISGGTTIVGAWGDDDNGSFSGSAYLFDITTGQQIAKLLPDDGAVQDSFGHSVAISGTTAIVGAMQDGDNGNNSGAVYLFDTVTGEQIAKLMPADGAEGDRFGYSVDISGSTAIIGALGDDDNGTDSGSAYLFDTATGQQITKLLPDDGVALDDFGISVAICGTNVIVGAWRDNDNIGSAYLFDKITGQQIAKLIANDGAVNDYFGRFVSISGSTAVIGAYKNEDDDIQSGSAYLFAAPAILADLNNDGSVGTSDLLILFAFWGEVDVFPEADLDGDGFVNTSDMLILFANWGPCE